MERIPFTNTSGVYSELLEMYGAYNFMRNVTHVVTRLNLPSHTRVELSYYPKNTGDADIAIGEPFDGVNVNIHLVYQTLDGFVFLVSNSNLITLKVVFFSWRKK